MVKASEGVIESYPSDLYHDAGFLAKMNVEKNLMDRQSEDGESLFWSVGDCGTHIGLCSNNKEERLWMASYGHYNHYKIEFEVSDSGLITVQLIRLED